ncbi:amidohydrolase 2 [Phialemonium atrogriseum]|uniref:6-methylsalicylate decarboxylase n=1 Tax=Phialemonium atrogriseum TaxID=1093897 RepID=A0AAJ0FKA7_9PEZI|nr:amidohydrolase 2 [Phialemonium atrogriseum]KAK1763890.1 amidohydrolase 2 [Phialemonium atrogriseum]
MAPNRIDIHHHFVPDFYREAVITSGGDPSGWFIPDWTPELDEAVNKKFGITTTILSLTAPGACILKDRDASAALARKTNEYAAKLRDSNPKKYGFFAALPNILDEDLALDEIAYSLDILKADGVTLFTRYGEDNHYLGHPDFKGIWAELNRRHAVVFVHPTHPVDISQVSGMPQPVIRYPFETTTTALDMLHNKTGRNNPNCKIILSHGGGTLPYLIGRPASILPKGQEELDAFWDDARNFYYDTAVAGTENVFKVLETFAKPGHLLYGSDTPYANNSIIDFHTSRQDSYKFQDSKMHDKINRENALELIPRLKD